MTKAVAAIRPAPRSSGGGPGMGTLLVLLLLFGTTREGNASATVKTWPIEEDRRNWDPNTGKAIDKPSAETFRRMFPPAAYRIASNRVLFPRSPETPHSPLGSRDFKHESEGATSALSGEPSPAGGKTYRALQGPRPDPLTVTVADTEQVNYDTKRITFAIPLNPKFAPDRPVLGVPAGLWISVEPKSASGTGNMLFARYTPVSDVDMPDRFQLMVKKYPNGRESTFMHSLQPGDKLEIRAPLGVWSNYKDYNPSDTPRDLLFIAGGIGITPVYSLTKRILGDPCDRTRIQLLWGVRGSRDLVLRRELEQLQTEYPERLQVTYVISDQDPQETQDGRAQIKQGHINKQVIQEALERCESGVLGDGSTKVWICGPKSMEDALAGRTGALSTFRAHRREPILRALGIDEEKTVLSELGINARQVQKFDGQQWGPVPYQSEFFKYLSGAISCSR
ncbi:unnamed protein product [Zymoseptoria tritici ST99CH_1A5]|uniref:NADH-cytochrome b5 reductase 2 n=1 Tax=Zymoseptoria tritici ST99CH_1A5 TaxID=1276529 RepID=A0A1Y6LZV2_ZYMTR|nr:unnamed protein product [Zymoseptoria tritici ST99CH_1A5]